MVVYNVIHETMWLHDTCLCASIVLIEADKYLYTSTDSTTYKSNKLLFARYIYSHIASGLDVHD